MNSELYKVFLVKDLSKQSIMEMDNFVYMNYKVFLKAEQINFFGSINFFFVPFFSFSFLYVKKKIEEERRK